MTALPDGVLFDSDGVVVDSERFSLAAFQEACESLGHMKLSDEDVMLNCGLTDPDILIYMERKYGAKMDLEVFSREKTRRYHELVSAGGLEVFEGVKELLAALRGAGVGFALASSGSREKIGFNLRAVGLEGAFPVVVSGEEVRAGKPAPDLFLEAARRLGARPVRCVVLEDSINGLRAARAAGMVAVGVTNTFPARVLQPEADVLVDSLREMKLEMLEKLISKI
ncbi:MAG: HAD family phosphatase [bacterium]